MYFSARKHALRYNYLPQILHSGHFDDIHLRVGGTDEFGRDMGLRGRSPLGLCRLTFVGRSVYKRINIPIVITSVHTLPPSLSPNTNNQITNATQSEPTFACDDRNLVFRKWSSLTSPGLHAIGIWQMTGDNCHIFLLSVIRLVRLSTWKSFMGVSGDSKGNH